MSAPVQYHFVVVLMWQGGRTQSRHGTIDVMPGATRDKSLDYIIGLMRHGQHGDPAVVFFSLEPNEILGGAQ